MQTVPPLARYAAPSSRPFAALLLALILAAMAGRAAADESWIADAAKAEVLVPPFKKTLYAGELVRLPTARGKALRVALAQGSSRALVVLIPVKDEKRVGPKEVLKDEPLVLLHSTAEADYFALKVFTGVASLEADVWQLEETVIPEGQKVEFPLVPYRQITGRFVNLSDFRSSFVYAFYSRDEDVSKATDYNRTVSLEFAGSNLTKTWKTPADRIVVETLRGKVLVRVGHPFEKVK